jgi:S1-C subfamily serine protease
MVVRLVKQLLSKLRSQILCASLAFIGFMLVCQLSTIYKFHVLAQESHGEIATVTAQDDQDLQPVPAPSASPLPSLLRLSQEAICDLAKRSTVRVPSGGNWGSGTLIAKHGSSQYSVVTSGHVVSQDQEFFVVETYEGKSYPASLLVRFDHGQKTGNDLAILQFESPEDYPIVHLTSWQAPTGVVAAGFPIRPMANSVDAQGFTCTEPGAVVQNLEEPMQNGYQMGYDLGVQNGMSGGPLFNDIGDVVGINGMAQPVLLANSSLYLYRDGQPVSENLSESLRVTPDQALHLLTDNSWAIPAETLVYLSPQGLDLSLTQSVTSRDSSVPDRDAPKP